MGTSPLWAFCQLSTTGHLCLLKILGRESEEGESNSHEWLRQNFSLQYQYNINQISDENKEQYQFGDN